MQELRLEEISVHQNKHTQHSYLQLNQTVLKKSARMNFGIRPWIKNWIIQKKNDTWELVPRPKNKNVIGKKWVFRNKLNEDGQFTRNKAILLCKGYAHIEGIDFEEIFSPVARIEAICLLLDYACSKNVKVYQMDIKSDFLNREL